MMHIRRIQLAPFPQVVLVWIAAALILINPGAITSLAAQNPVLAFSDLSPGWNTIRPGGETVCAHGDDYMFYVRPGTRDRLLVYFHGGGACWNAEGCRQGSGVYIQVATRSPESMNGILDLAHPENPFRDYTMVTVPVCTGDVHVGDRDAVYVVEGNDGSRREFMVHHRGQTNTFSALAWIQENLEAPSEIFVAGSSAGNHAVPLYGSWLAREFPAARVVGIGDDNGGLAGRGTTGIDLSRWGLPEVFREHPGWEEAEIGTGVPESFITAALGSENLSLYQVDHAFDLAQRFYLERAGTPDPDVLALIRANRAAIRERVPEFRGFTMGGFFHTMLNHPNFYRYRVGEVRLRDWIASVAAGDPVVDVECLDCEKPEFIYDELDLALVNRVADLLHDPEAWEPKDPGGRCPQSPTRYTLRCALITAIVELGAQTRSPPGAHEIVLAARLPDDRSWNGAGRALDPLIPFNNAPGRTHGEILKVVDQARTRIEADHQGDRTAWKVELTGDPITIGHRHSIHSEILGEERHYMVHLPDRYEDPAWTPRHHPVLYVLDAEHTFNLTVGLTQALSIDLQIPELIVVGIPNTNRVRDLSPTNNPVWRDGQEREVLRSSGGADDFLRFLESELIPRVDDTYRTLPHRTLVGHSLGGLFALHAFLEAPGFFQAHIVSDPALDWDERVLHSRLEERLADAGKDAESLRGPVFISLANTPRNVVFLDPDEWAGAIRAFASTLDDRGPDELRSTLAYFDDEDHTSVLLPTIFQGLRFVFQGHRPEFAEIMDRPSEIGPHFQALAAKLELELLPPEWFLEFWGQQWLLFGGDPDRAIEAFTVHVAFYPDSHRGHDGLGMAWEVKGDTARAIEHFRKSLELNPDNPATRERLEALKDPDPLSESGSG